MSDSQDTLLKPETILEAISGMRQEMNSQINALRQEMNARFDDVEARLTSVENQVREMSNLQLTFDVRIDRLEAMAHESLQVAFSSRADVKILRAEVAAWAKDVAEIQRQIA